MIGKLTEKKDNRVYPVQILVMEGAIWRSTLALHQPQNRTFCLMKQYTVLSRPRSSPSEVHRASPNYRRVNTPPLPSPSSSSSSSVSKPSSFSFHLTNRTPAQQTRYRLHRRITEQPPDRRFRNIFIIQPNRKGLVEVTCKLVRRNLRCRYWWWANASERTVLRRRYIPQSLGTWVVGVRQTATTAQCRRTRKKIM